MTVHAFKIDVPTAVLEDLRSRLASTAGRKDFAIPFE